MRKCDDSKRGKNWIYDGDTIDVLRRYIADESVDLIYQEPPLNSNRDYSVTFSEDKVNDEQSQAHMRSKTPGTGLT